MRTENSPWRGASKGGREPSQRWLVFKEKRAGTLRDRDNGCYRNIINYNPSTTYYHSLFSLLLSKTTVPTLSHFLLYWNPVQRLSHFVLEAMEAQRTWLTYQESVYYMDGDLRLLDCELAPWSMFCIFNVTLVPWYWTPFQCTAPQNS